MQVERWSSDVLGQQHQPDDPGLSEGEEVDLSGSAHRLDAHAHPRLRKPLHSLDAEVRGRVRKRAKSASWGALLRFELAHDSYCLRILKQRGIHPQSALYRLRVPRVLVFAKFLPAKPSAPWQF